MKIPRRLKEIISRYASILSIEQSKRGYVLINQKSERMTVDTGHVVTLEQWDDLASRIKRFASSRGDA
jgi:hypothetical protein